MAVELDIAGNFAKGQDATLRRRRARQLERGTDYELAGQDLALRGMQDDLAQQEDIYGLAPLGADPLHTNQDPWFSRLQQWWKQRRASRVMPSNMLPEQQQTAVDASAALGVGGDEYAAGDGFADGGQVRRAIPRYADGGGVADEAEMIRRRAAANRARNPGTMTNATETAIPRTPGMMTRAGGALRRGVNVAGKKFAPVALGATAVDTAMTDTEQYRKRFGMAPGSKETGFWGDVGARALGAASDLGNVLTFGQAGKMYRDQQPDEEASPPMDVTVTKSASDFPDTGIPKTPDEAVAQQAISDGTKMAEQAQERSAPPGAVDFSKVDFNSGDIPNMPVKDWVDYRARMVRNLMAQGMKPADAHAQVSKIQQQGFIDYAQQALMHLQSGNANAAATALRAAYQYFPNGTDVQLGAQQGKDGQPVLVGMGRDEETGKPKGSPMILNAERLSTMIENFSNPEAFRAWTKDWRDEQFNRQKYEEVEKPQAQNTARYQNRMAGAAELNARANMADARARGNASGARKQVDLDRANAAFTDAVEMLGLTDQDQSDRLMSVMSQIYQQSSWQYPQVIEFVRKAQKEGRLDEVMQALGLGE